MDPVTLGILAIGGAVTVGSFLGATLSNFLFKNNDKKSEINHQTDINAAIRNDIHVMSNEVHTQISIELILLILILIMLSIIFIFGLYKIIMKCRKIKTKPRNDVIELSNV